LISEIDQVCDTYPELRHIYLEVETIGASITKALALFEALADYNAHRAETLSFRMNLAVHSNFMKYEEKVRQFFDFCQKANVNGLNVGLESGSERVRKEVLRRPKYSNKELVAFCLMAKEYGISITLFALVGAPGETLLDFKDTVSVVRDIQPDSVYLSIFYPYIGTDLYRIAEEQGLIPSTGLDNRGERSKATLDLPGFPKNRVRRE
jgi:anaerobic magnesium-protoporphyrin IX monomethyl ester cyclase